VNFFLFAALWRAEKPWFPGERFALEKNPGNFCGWKYQNVWTTLTERIHQFSLSFYGIY
jgi:hypothetical protein